MMKLYLTILTFLTWTSVFGQTSIIGDWITFSIGLDSEVKGITKIHDRYDKVQFTFNGDGSYIKSYYVPKGTTETPLYKHYEIRDEKLVKKRILTEDGYHLKVLVVKEKIEKGRYDLNSTGDTIVFNSESGVIYKHGFKLESSSLTLMDTVDNRIFYITLLTDRKKTKKRGSS